MYFLAIGDSGGAGSDLMATVAEPGGLVYSCLTRTPRNLKEALAVSQVENIFLGKKICL